MWGCTHHNNDGTEEIPACFPPQPEDIVPAPNHHLNIFYKMLPPCSATGKHGKMDKIPGDRTKDSPFCISSEALSTGALTKDGKARAR